MEGEDNVASEPPSMAPGNVASTLTMIGSVRLESYVTVRSQSTVAPEGALVTVDTGPGHVVSTQDWTTISIPR